MRSIKSILGAGALLCAASLPTFGVEYTLYEYAFNIDGAVSDSLYGDPTPSEVDLSGFDTLTGLGSIKLTLSGGGSHNVAVFLDHEIDEGVNGFLNDTGNHVGSPTSGQSWEIGDPSSGGVIWSHFSANPPSLQNTGDISAPGEDISMAMGWNFSLVGSETAVISLLIGTSAPGGFYLEQTDRTGLESIFFSGNLRISGGGPPSAPDSGATIVSLLIGFLGLAGVKRAVNRTNK